MDNLIGKESGGKIVYRHCSLSAVLVFALGLSLAPQICVFTATMKLNATGTVYGANIPIAGAYVSASPSIDGGNGSGFAITDSLGNYNMTTGLTAGSYNVTAFAFGYIESEIGFVNVTVGQTTTDIDFDLQTSGGISGIVTDAVSGIPLNGTSIYAYLSNGTGTFGWFGTAGSDGTYLIATNLVSGMYNVTILLPPDGYIADMTTANVTAGIETKNVDIQLPRSGIISGRVAAPNGTGLFGIDVTASVSGEGLFYFGSTRTDLLGNYRIVTGLGTGNYTVYASGAGNFTVYGGFLNPTEVSVVAGQETTGIDMELTPVTTPPTPSGTITGRVTDQHNQPIGFASVIATGSNGTGFSDTDINGYYNITDGLGTGNDYNVSATANGYYDASYMNLVSVIVDQTTANIDIQMIAKPPETFGTIAGTVMGGPNPIVPEFQTAMVEMLSLTLAAVIVGKLMLKTRSHKNKGMLS